MSRSIWVTMTKKDEARAQAVYRTASQYGLGVEGHFWKADMNDMAWSEVVPELGKKETGMWLIVGDHADFTKPVLRGLSLLALAVQTRREGRMPIMILTDDPDTLAQRLPSPLSAAEALTPDAPALGAKMTARANLPAKALPAAEYRLDLFALPGVGLWLEAGPAGETWQGVVVGAGRAGIDAMGIGPAGEIPDRSVLEYPLRDMKLALGEVEFTAWAADNRVSPGESVYVRLTGDPDAVIFGPFDRSAGDLDVYTLFLC